MHLFDLPLELFGLITEQITRQLPIEKVMEARLVCKTFDREIANVLCRRHARDWVAGATTLCPTIPPNDKWAARIIMLVAASRGQRTQLLLQTLQTVAEQMMARSGKRDEKTRFRYLEAASACVVAWQLPILRPTLVLAIGGPNYIKHICFTVAAWLGDLDLVKAFLISTPYMNAYIFYFCSPLWAAGHQGHFEIIQYLMSQGADLDAFDDSYGSAFVGACLGGHVEMVEYMVNLGLDSVKDLYQEYFSLIASKAYYDAGVIEHFMWQFGCDDKLIHSTLVTTCKTGAVPAAKLLIDNAAHITPTTARPEEPWYYEPLICAAGNGHVRIVQLLLSKGAEVNHDSALGSAVMNAMRWGKPRVLDVLFAAGANIDPLDRFVFESAIAAAQLGSIKWLLDHGYDINGPTEHDATRSARGRKFVQMATRLGCPEILRLLAGYGCDVFRPYFYAHYGYRAMPRLPIWVALRNRHRHGNHDMVRVLLELGSPLWFEG
ncbi:uncharacterized protein K452DRAFT_312632 [Aplosporella prunicola CBS 121167]|uniref:Uncharacterized protein n=1 Tax=Aplosporella prunicola CBS 121167 TaxID=1176127 RepID=A0A6A6AZ59_9PEZI|nr:uncharacterized protein K452DRAFT_312632 [Aplosporella prunicola CBS 121167]KAF2137070.1 hypothetical protein K452DRAFT_312632 [Aplosporella prunicola CBS 121167]